MSETSKLKHIPLAQAYLCQDCDSVGNNAMQCPACASQVVLGLAGVLDREPSEQIDKNYSHRPALVA